MKPCSQVFPLLANPIRFEFMLEFPCDLPFHSAGDCGSVHDMAGEPQEIMDKAFELIRKRQK